MKNEIAKQSWIWRLLSGLAAVSTAPKFGPKVRRVETLPDVLRSDVGLEPKQNLRCEKVAHGFFGF